TSLDHKRDPNLQLAVRMTDDSMADLIMAGDVCIVEVDTCLHDDRPMAMITKDGIMIRKVVEHEGHFILIPQNKSYKTTEVPDATILGYVHTVIKAAGSSLAQQALLLLVMAVTARQALKFLTQLIEI